MKLHFCRIACETVHAPGFSGQDADIVQHDPVAKVNVVLWLSSLL
jgi:hypothetical protein